jgi:hypothetical protein
MPRLSADHVVRLFQLGLSWTIMGKLAGTKDLQWGVMLRSLIVDGGDPLATARLLATPQKLVAILRKAYLL